MPTKNSQKATEWHNTFFEKEFKKILSRSFFNDSIQWRNLFDLVYKQQQDINIFSKEKILTLCLSSLEMRLKAIYCQLMYNLNSELDPNQVVQKCKKLGHKIYYIYEKCLELRSDVLKYMTISEKWKKLDINHFLDLSEEEKKILKYLESYGMDFRYSFPTFYQKKGVYLHFVESEDSIEKEKWESRLKEILNQYKKIYDKSGRAYVRILALSNKMIESDFLNNKDLSYAKAILRWASWMGWGSPYHNFLKKNLQ